MILQKREQSMPGFDANQNKQIERVHENLLHDSINGIYFCKSHSLN